MPELQPFTPEDFAVYQAAVDLIRARFKEGRHHVGAAVRGASGRLFAGLHLQGVIGEPAVCAEVIAIGGAMAAGEERITSCVAVRHPKARENDGSLKILPPCGSCRELIADYGGKEAWVLLEVAGEFQKTHIADLIPLRRWTRGPSDIS